MGSAFEARLADYACRLVDVDLPATVQQEAKIRVIDAIGCALGALDAPPVAAARRIGAQTTSPHVTASVWGSQIQTHPEMATFINGVACRYLDFNDIYLGIEACHPSDNLPAAWAVAEAEGRSGRELLSAIVAGYQVHCLLADSASLKNRGFDNVLYGAIAASVMAGLLLHATVDQITEAIRIATVSSVALLQTRVGELSMWKGMAAAHAARNGVFAAYLAQQGVTGPQAVFEGTKGFRSVVAPQFTPPMLAQSKTDYKLLETRLKPFAAQYFLQSVIECACRLRGQVDLRAISEVRVETFDYAFEVAANDPEKWHPDTRETADHSLPYCTAIALLSGDVGLEAFEPGAWNNPVIHELMAKITVAVNPDFSLQYPAATPAAITITTTIGATLHESVNVPAGHPNRPLDDLGISRKFSALASRSMSPRAATALLDALWNLDGLDVLPLMPVTIPAASPVVS